MLRKNRCGSAALGLMALALFISGLAGGALGEVLKVSQAGQQLYPSPDFASPPVGPVPMGAQVTVLGKSGDWCNVEYGGKAGWLHRQAFPGAPAAAGLGLPGLLTGAPVKETRGDEVALAGKGFTPEVESAYRQKHPELNFAQVDKIEALRVDDARLAAFIREGGLNP